MELITVFRFQHSISLNSRENKLIESQVKAIQLNNKFYATKAKLFNSLFILYGTKNHVMWICPERTANNNNNNNDLNIHSASFFFTMTEM